MTPIPDGDGSVLRLLLDWAWAGVLALCGIIWNKNEKKLEKHEEQIGLMKDQHTDDLRELYDKFESRNQRAEDRHNELKDIIYSEISKLRNLIK